MKTKIKDGNRAGAVADYNSNVGGVKTLFDATSDTGTVKAKFVSEYGSSSDIVSNFLTTVEAPDVSDEAKNELVEKTLMDMVTMHLVLDKINTGTTVSDWDEAAAYYIGDRAASKTDIFTTYDRAEKRAAEDNFNTLTSGEASINAAIINALKSPSDESRIKIRELYQALYAQNVLKYAYEIDACARL
jgi:hypothetical protein